MNEKKSRTLVWIKENPLAAYFILTFAITWSLLFHSPFIAYMGSTISAILITGLLEGWGGVKGLIKRSCSWRVGPQWYLFVLFGSTVLGLIAIGAYVMLFKQSHTLSKLILANISLSLVSGVREEFGWRGFALPRLLKKPMP